ncbi:hypothetical protein GBA65_05265 [Rubrobacter marinus]|uniref:DUF5615 domain-containing protein n=1 Tax=Rubrobacter marinus TaxID=2653852 RepID=A0A6G8PV09_9ACTN|nr:DUF5615 family PIN-like protein [Rubrobacter marinus]QIN78023.1 hypothetical protein GBA65_05265 [Rubrobacter marinus]
MLADEGVEYPVVERLREDGHEVTYVAEMEPGIPDDEVLDSANREQALPITADRDFGELVFRQRRVHSGVILVRLSGLNAQAKASIVSAAIEEHAEEYPGAFAVITPGVVRLRRRED